MNHNYNSTEAIKNRIKGIERAIIGTKESIKNWNSEVRDDSDLKAFLKHLNKQLTEEVDRLKISS